MASPWMSWSAGIGPRRGGALSPPVLLELPRFRGTGRDRAERGGTEPAPYKFQRAGGMKKGPALTRGAFRNLLTNVV